MNPPKVCEELRRHCVLDHVEKGKCTDEETCFLGNQSFEQVEISCCVPMSPPPSAPPPLHLCEQFVDRQQSQMHTDHLDVARRPQ